MYCSKIKKKKKVRYIDKDFVEHSNGLDWILQGGYIKREDTKSRQNQEEQNANMLTVRFLIPLV